MMSSLNNSKIGDYVDGIYPNELEKEYHRAASYLDLHLEIDREGQFKKEDL